MQRGGHSTCLSPCTFARLQAYHLCRCTHGSQNTTGSCSWTTPTRCLSAVCILKQPSVQVHVWQPEHCWLLQLENSHEVAPQLEAVAALAAMPHASPAVAAALRAILFSDDIFCRRGTPAGKLATTDPLVHMQSQQQQNLLLT